MAGQNRGSWSERDSGRKNVFSDTTDTHLGKFHLSLFFQEHLCPASSPEPGTISSWYILCWNTDPSTFMLAPESYCYLLKVWIQKVKKWPCAIVGNYSQKIFSGQCDHQQNCQQLWPSCSSMFSSFDFTLTNIASVNSLPDDCDRCEIMWINGILATCGFSYCFVIIYCMLEYLITF